MIVSAWSRGMILPLGGRGPGFDSRSRPLTYQYINIQYSSNYSNFSFIHIQLIYAHYTLKSLILASSKNYILSGVQIVFVVAVSS